MKRIAMLGMPNTGKSTLFNRLTGSHAKVGNWPGLTVDLMTARLLIGDQIVQLVDLPGIYDIDGYSEDERVVTRFIAENTIDIGLFVLNVTQIDRQLPLLLQVLNQNFPVVVVLNMADEASALGISIDPVSLAAGLGVPVCLMSAKYGQGMEQLMASLRAEIAQQTQRDKVERSARPSRLEFLESTVKSSVQIPIVMSTTRTEKIDRVLLHPWLGLPLFFFVMFLLFELVFAVGKPIQDIFAWGFTEIRAQALEPLTQALPLLLQGLLLDGVYNGLSTVASFVPIIILFFLCMGVVEDSGYLSRAAFLMDALMSRFGLDGRSFVMLLMGFGCNVPALMGTRVIRSRGLRLLSMLIIPFSLCSARMQVFVFFIAALFTAQAAPLVLFSLYVASIIAAMLTSLIFKRRYVNNDPFIIEMPPYRLPTLRQVIVRGTAEVGHFIKRATRFIVAGVVLVWLLTNFPQGVAAGGTETWAGQIGALLDPLLSPLGIDPKLTIALIFGFVAKEIVIGSLAVIYGQEGDALINSITHQITWIQAYSFMLFSLIYTPCLSTIATIRTESKSISFSILAVVWPLVLAWVVSFLFYQVAIHFFVA